MPRSIPCHIRRAGPDDAMAIDTLYRELVADPQVRVLPAAIAALADSPTSYLLIAEDVAGDRTVCATALLTLCPDVMYGGQPFGVVENVVVAAARRGLGIGRQLMQHLEILALRHDCSKLMLSSARSRAEAHRFFQRCGFSGTAKLAFVKYRSQFSESAG